jgi:hypothetical protein
VGKVEQHKLLGYGEVAKPTMPEVLMLSYPQLYRIWRARLLALCPDTKYHRYRFNNLLWLVIGVYLARHVYLGLIARKLPIRAQKLSLVRRLRRFLDNSALRVQDWYEPVMDQLLQAAAGSGGIHLIIDGTQVGTHYQLLMVALVYRRRALPLAWSWVAIPNGNGRSTQQQIRLLAVVRRHIHPLTGVVLVGNTEFGGGKLITQLKTWGWYYALHQRATNYFVPAGRGGVYHFADAPVKAGEQLWLEYAGLTRALVKTNILIYWERGHAHPWYLTTNLLTAHRTLRCYQRRMWIETLFGDFKRHGFHLRHSRLGTAERLSRLTLVVCLLYVWLVAMGHWVQHSGQVRQVDRWPRRELSLFRLGWDWVERCLTLGDALPNVGLPTFPTKVSAS